MMITYLEKRGENMGDKSLYYLTCVLFYIVAIINFFNSDTTTGAVWLCLGSVFLCLGASQSNKKDKQQGDDDSDII